MSSPICKTILIYIPCHSDHESARNNTKNIRSQFQELNLSDLRQEFQVKIFVSVNGTNLSSIEYDNLKEHADEVICFTELLGADININQGFVHALVMKPDYFWILSANEILVPGAIQLLLKTISENQKSNVYVTNSKNRITSYETSNLFLDIPDGSGFGLISSVIYDFKTTSGAFSAGPRFAWTGWGQLAVLQTACNILGKITVSEIPDVEVYGKTFTDVDPNSQISEFEYVRSAYAHSFFGMIIIVAALFANNKSIRNEIFRSWIKSNWYKIHYFKLGAMKKVDSTYPQFDPTWMVRIATKALYLSGMRVLVLSLIGSHLDIERLRRQSVFVRIRKLLKI